MEYVEYKKNVFSYKKKEKQKQKKTKQKKLQMWAFDILSTVFTE